MSDEFTKLGELEKLLEQGFLTSQYVYKSDDGEFRFEFKTLTPLQEQMAIDEMDEKESNEKKEEKRTLYLAIALLSRSITKVNGVKLEEVPGAKGDTDLEKRKKLISSISEVLLLELWRAYLELRKKTNPENSPEGAEAVKKS